MVEAGRAPAGLAPLSHAPAVAVDYLRADLLAELPDDVKALILGPCLDMINQMTVQGAPPITIRAMRGMLQRVLRGAYDVEVRRALMHPGIDIDTTGW